MSAADSIRAFLEGWRTMSDPPDVIASVDVGDKIGQDVRILTASALVALLDQLAAPEGASHHYIPKTYPFVLFGWGDTDNGTDQTCTIILDGAKPGQDHHPGHLSPLQRRIAVMRLRYVADLIDPDKIWDLPERTER